MSPILKTVATFEEFSFVVDCLWESNIKPFNPFMSIIVRIKEPTAEGVAAAIQEMKERLWKTHKADKDSVWVYIVDEDKHGEESGKALAGAEWLFHEVNPFEEKTDDEKHENKDDEIEDGEKNEEDDNSLRSLWPEGEARGFTKMIFSQVFGFRAKRMTRPHTHFVSTLTNISRTLHDVYPPRPPLSWLWILAHGIWNEQNLEMNVEALVEATAEGLPLYEKFGFRTIEIITIDTTCRDRKPGFLWLKMANEVKGMTTWWMWKPKPSEGEVYTLGMELPWERK